MEGMMGTFDEETRRFFKDTMVACRLSYRTGFSKVCREEWKNFSRYRAWMKREFEECVHFVVLYLP